MAVHGESCGVIGLISGGKDSLFSLLHCLANGHRIIALANLFPPHQPSSTEEAEDLNSFMYQTAGHQAIPLFAEALGLPLYRDEISGWAKNTSKDYRPASSSSGNDRMQVGSVDDIDETESLVPLLRKIINLHPTTNAVCSGAILSTYQRTRIESVARRLNLVPLCYLWQYPSLPPRSPGGLLDDMAAADFDVRIVKVASGGLDENFLWKNLMEPAVRQRLSRALAKFGGSVLGEGGEYETLVVDGPPCFWHGRLNIKVDESSVRKGSGGEAWLGFKDLKGVVGRKKTSQSTNYEIQNKVRLPSIHDQQISTLREDLRRKTFHRKTETNDQETQSGRCHWTAKSACVRTTSIITISNITAADAGAIASDQMFAINTRLVNLLADEYRLNTRHVVFTTILLRSMADFSIVNKVYAQLFSHPNPAARVTVACGDMLPPGVQVMTSFVISQGDEQEGLHVQSRSYWAPANIGPYSQAISVPLKEDTRIVYVAGQVPLIPASMERINVHEEDVLDAFIEETCLALQHLWRVGAAMKVRWWTNAIVHIARGTDMEAKAIVAWEAWKNIHNRKLWINDDEDDEQDDIDVWDRLYSGSGSLVEQESNSPRLPDFASIPSTGYDTVPPYLAVQMDELPRDCSIEWQSAGIGFERVNSARVPNVISHVAIDSQHGLHDKVQELLDRRQTPNYLDATIYTVHPELIYDLVVQVIPCRALWGPAGLKLFACIVIREHFDTPRESSPGQLKP